MNGIESKLAQETGADLKAREFCNWSHVVSLLFAQLAHSIGLNAILLPPCAIVDTAREWKKQLLRDERMIFEAGASSAGAAVESHETELYEQIGRLKMELGWLNKSLEGSSLEGAARVGPAARTVLDPAP